MTKDELKAKIKNVAQQLLSQKEENQLVDLDQVGPEEEKFAYFKKFPSLKNIVVDLLTDKYFLFVIEIQWVAPKPTTFKIVLANNQYFFLIFEEKSWIAQIEGKKYYLSSIKEKQNSLTALSRILRYGFQGEEDSQPKEEDKVDLEDKEESEEET